MSIWWIGCKDNLVGQLQSLCVGWIIFSKVIYFFPASCLSHSTIQGHIAQQISGQSEVVSGSTKHTKISSQDNDHYGFLFILVLRFTQYRFVQVNTLYPLSETDSYKGGIDDPPNIVNSSRSSGPWGLSLVKVVSVTLNFRLIRYSLP